MKSLKKTSIIFGILSLIALFAVAKQEKVLQIFRNGEVIQEYAVDDIDYIEVNDHIPAPSDVNATVSNDQITIKWNAIEGATYNIYRSADNVNFTLLASKLTETTYTDTKPLRGSNFYRVKAVVGDVESGYTSSAAAALTNSELDNGIYLGITGFNEDIYEFPITQLTENSVDSFRNFVNGLTKKDGTLLYHSVNQALDKLQTTELPENITTAAIVTFTDGLDEGSFSDDFNVLYNDDMEYLDAINHRIKNETVAGQPITAFSIGLRGSDVTNIQKFVMNIDKLASSKENSMEIASVSELNTKFKEIASKLTVNNYIQQLNLKIAQKANGTIVRFTFDNVSSADKSKLYIEGVYNATNKSLENVTYVGLTSTSGTTISGVKDGIFVRFSFEGVHTDNNVMIKPEFTDKWTYDKYFSSWDPGSESEKIEEGDVQTEKSSAVIMLVLDCSSSLADDFDEAKTNAKDFISTLYQAVGGTENPGEQEGTIYSTTPIDLSIAAFNIKNGTRYYLTYEEFATANLTDYHIDGLTVCSAMGDFIISPKLLQEDACPAWLANIIYANILPDKTQASITTARYTDINNALSKFGFDPFNKDQIYLTSEQVPETESEPYNYAYSHKWGHNIDTMPYGHIRGIISTDSPSIYWNMPTHLQLAVEKDGRIFYTEDPAEDLSRYDNVLGIVLYAGGLEIAVELNDAQTDALNFDLAKGLYGNILPDYSARLLIDNYWSELQNAITKFNGNAMSSSNKYWTIEEFEGEGAGVLNHKNWKDIWTKPFITFVNSKNVSNYVRGVHIISIPTSSQALKCKPKIPISITQ